jgi:spermidine/putrescine-binding protein
MSVTRPGKRKLELQTDCRNGRSVCRSSFRLFLLCLLAIVAGPGCDRRESAKNILNIYTWSEYLPQPIIEKFTARTGIRVNVDTYDSNEVLLEKLQSGVADYDLVTPSDYMVKILIAQKLVQPLEHAKLSHFRNLDARFLDKQFDPGNRYSIPYFWGTTGIGYNQQAITSPVESWNALFDESHDGKVLMLDDMRECFAVALKRMGKSLNETDPAVLREAATMLKQQKKLVKTYNSGDFSNILASGDVALAHGFNGQLAELAAQQPDKFTYVVPREGGTFWMDNLCLRARARHVEAAYAFLDFILEAETGAEIVNIVHYANANLPARQLIRPEILHNPAVYPPEHVLARCEFIEDIGETTTLLDQLWTEIKAQ